MIKLSLFFCMFSFTGEHAAPSDAVDDRKSKLQLADYFSELFNLQAFHLVLFSCFLSRLFITSYHTTCKKMNL